MMTSQLDLARVEPINTREKSDEDLVAAVNAGDPAAFEALYYRHRDWVAGLAFRFCGDRELALDVLQETFLYFLKKFPGFRLTAQLKTFFYPAVRNLSLAAKRKSDRLNAQDPHDEVMESAAAGGPMPGEDAELGALLEGMSQDHRETLLLRFVDGLSLAEIAEAMDVPPGTVKSRLHHALQNLRQDPRTRNFFVR